MCLIQGIVCVLELITVNEVEVRREEFGGYYRVDDDDDNHQRKIKIPNCFSPLGLLTGRDTYISS